MDMETLQKQTSLFTEDNATSSREDSLVSLTQLLESEKAKMMRDISGRKCSEQLRKFNQVGSWAKMFTDLLIGQEGWFSTRCNLTWKLRGTKYSRMYCQLQVSKIAHTDGTGFGLLPTPQVMDIRTDVRKPEERSNAANNGGCSNLREWAGNGLLPTPTAMDSTNATATMKSTQVKEGSMHSVTLSRAMAMGMLPTPTTRDWKGAQGNEYKEMMGEETEYKMQSLPGLAMKGMLPTPSAFDWNTAQKVDKYEERKQIQAKKGVNLHYPLKQMAMDINPTGSTSQLSHHFVSEMMGFPKNYLDLW